MLEKWRITLDKKGYGIVHNMLLTRKDMMELCNIVIEKRIWRITLDKKGYDGAIDKKGYGGALDKKGYGGALDKKGYGGAILMDLSKAFDSLNYQLLIAKLNAYGFTHRDTSKLGVGNYDRWQITKVNNTFSSCLETLLGVTRLNMIYVSLIYT